MTDSEETREDTHEVEDPMEMETSVGGAAEILQLQQEIDVRLQKMSDLERHHKERILKASLLSDAQYHYNQHWKWYNQKKWKKEHVLLALKSDVIPEILRWNQFEQYCPKKLLQDREILLARLELDDFESTFVCEAYQVPKKFRNDKEVMLKICSQNSHALEFASKKLQNDPDVVLAAIQQPYHFSPLALQFASLRLRGDKKIVRVALNREHGIRAAKFLAPKLQNDRRLILTSIRRSSADCSEYYEHLSELSEELCADEEIVMAAVRKRGSNLRFVKSPQLLEDVDIALAACKQDGNSIQFVRQGPALDVMMEPSNLRTVILNGGGAALEYDCDDYSEKDDYYDYSSKNLDDYLLFLAAVDNGLVPFTVLKEIFYKNRTLTLELLRRSSQLYMKLPDKMKADVHLALAALEGDNLDEIVGCRILKSNPSLCSNAKVMELFASRGLLRVLSEGQVPDEIRDNKALMILACQANSDLFMHCSDRLSKDPDVISAAISSIGDCHPTWFFGLDEEVLEQNPRLVQLALDACNCWDWKELFEFLPRAVFRNRSTLLAFLRKDLAFIEGIPYARLLSDGGFGNDRQLILAALKHKSGVLIGLHGDIHLNLLNDRAFIKEAIAVDSRVIGRLPCGYPYHEVDYRHDFEMMLLAVAASKTTLQAFMHQDHNVMGDLVKFASQVREKLRVADVFIGEFLRGIDVVKPNVAPALRCRLPMLDKGYETGAALKKLIAQYVGIPLGEELRLLRGASENLEFWGY